MKVIDRVHTYNLETMRYNVINCPNAGPEVSKLDNIRPRVTRCWLKVDVDLWSHRSHRSGDVPGAMRVCRSGELALVCQVVVAGDYGSRGDIEGYIRVTNQVECDVNDHKRGAPWQR